VALAVVAYDSTLRRWMLDWGTTPGKPQVHLPGDEIIDNVMTYRTRAVTSRRPTRSCVAVAGADRRGPGRLVQL
jgi:hypothetical protein